ELAKTLHGDRPGERQAARVAGGVVHGEVGHHDDRVGNRLVAHGPEALAGAAVDDDRPTAERPGRERRARQGVGAGGDWDDRAEPAGRRAAGVGAGRVVEGDGATAGDAERAREGQRAVEGDVASDGHAAAGPGGRVPDRVVDDDYVSPGL